MSPLPLSAEFFEAQMEVVIEEQVPVYVSGLGNPGPWMDRLKANGTKVGAVVGKVKHAVQVKSSGVDFIVAQGHDGGGHNSPIGTMALIPQVVDAVGDLPILGAGGIGDGRGVAAAFMLGAEGVWVGRHSSPPMRRESSTFRSRPLWMRRKMAPPFPAP